MGMREREREREKDGDGYLDSCLICFASQRSLPGMAKDVTIEK
jgi:hypothetical protein